MDKATVCTLALQRIGMYEYASGTPGYEVCKVAFPLLYKTLLCAGDWSFARRRVVLSCRGDGEYELPPDCLRIVQLEGLRHWRRLGRMVRAEAGTAASGDVVLVYTSGSHANRGEVPEDDAPLFAEVLVVMLASRLAVPLASDHRLRQELELEGRARLDEALTLDVQQDASNDQHPLARLQEQSITDSY